MHTKAKRPLFVVAGFLLILLSGCAEQLNPIGGQRFVTNNGLGQDEVSSNEAQARVDLIPPVPTFNSLADCERAYGQGACSTGQEVYGTANLPPPPEITGWYMPLEYSAMTGVLVNQYFAPPAVYIVGFRYRDYLGNRERYRGLNQEAVLHFRRAPSDIQRQVYLHGRPMQYSPPARSGFVEGNRTSTGQQSRASGATVNRSVSAPTNAPVSAPAGTTTNAPARTRPAPRKDDRK